MKIAIGQIFHEGNDFNLNPTVISDFEHQNILVGAEILDNYPAASEIGGFIRRTRDLTDIVELIPTIRAIALPSGRVSSAAYLWLKQQILSILEKHCDLDGVFLALHGAMVVEDLDDSEGDLLAAVRDVVGQSVPIVVTLDLHANITGQMLSNANIVVGYKTSPHEDMEEIGYETGGLLLDLIGGRLGNLHCYWRKMPMISPTETHITGDGPYGALYQHLSQLSEDPGIVSASLFTVTPWLDVSDLGFGVVAYSSVDRDVAKNLVDSVCQLAWSTRNELLVEKTNLEAGIDFALKHESPPVLMIHGSDSTLAGAPGDNTAVLHALLARECEKPVFLAITDASVVRKARATEIGKCINVMLGGKRDRLFCKPVPMAALLTKVVDATAKIEGPVLSGVTFHLGYCAVLVSGKLTVVVTENAFPGHDPSVFRCVGLTPEGAQAIVVNSTIHYRSNYRHVSQNQVLLDTQGASSSNLAALPFKRIPRPLFPIDK